LGLNREIEGITGSQTEIEIRLKHPAQLINLRTKRNLGKGQIFYDMFNPWEANIYIVKDSR
jgi:hypothetical protein